MLRLKNMRCFRKIPVLFLVSLITLIGGCTHIEIDDCGGGGLGNGRVLGNNEPRIRSSHFRMFLDDLPAASERFISFAAMSSLTYAEDKDCGTPLEKRKISPQDREKLQEILNSRGWNEIKEPLWVPLCENEVGLYLKIERNCKKF